MNIYLVVINHVPTRVYFRRADAVAYANAYHGKVFRFRVLG